MPPHLHPLPAGERVRVRAKLSSIQYHLWSNTDAINLVLPLVMAFLEEPLRL
jgi:hypothetical protein